MADAASHQRSLGRVEVSFKLREGRTVLDGLRQEGCLKLRLPRAERGEWAGAVLLNTSGGVAGGDRLRVRVVGGAGTRATVASQAAERFYRALPGSSAVVANEVRVEAGAALEWLPQETILFDGSALRRRLLVDVAVDGWFLGVESQVFGRAAMGEVVERADLNDLIEVRRDRTLKLHDRVRCAGPVAGLLARAAVGGGAGAAATLVHVARDAQTRLDAVREALAPFEAGASAWDGMLIARIVAPSGACLRAAVVAGLRPLRGGRRLPRVWLC